MRKSPVTKIAPIPAPVTREKTFRPIASTTIHRSLGCNLNYGQSSQAVPPADIQIDPTPLRPSIYRNPGAAENWPHFLRRRETTNRRLAGLTIAQTPQLLAFSDNEPNRMNRQQNLFIFFVRFQFYSPNQRAPSYQNSAKSMQAPHRCLTPRMAYHLPSGRNIALWNLENNHPRINC